MASNRLAIGQGLVLLLQGIINPATNQPVYGIAKLGAVFDPTPYSSFVEVVDPRGKVAHMGSGGTQIGWRVQDEVMFKMTSGWEYEQDSEAAMVSMLTAQDIVLPTFASHVMVPDPNNPSQPIASVFSLLEDNGQTDQAVPSRFPNGRVYLLWNFTVLVKQQYNILLSIP
jgi:hypothetical protein